MSLTLASAQAELAMWESALAAVLSSQSYQIGSGGSLRTLTRADLAEIKKGRDEARRNVAALESGRGLGLRVLSIVPRDV